MLRDQSNRLLDTQDTMRAFADMTGGHAYINTNDTSGAIRDAAHDGSDYYMLSYAVDKSDRRPGWRKINVKVGDYHVRARHGYFLTQTTMDPKVTAGYDMDNALKSPFSYTGLPFRVVLEPPVSQGDKRKVSFAMTMPPKAATVDNTDNNHLHVDIAYAVWNASGQDAAHKGTSYNLNLNPAQLQMVDTKGLGYGDSFRIASGSLPVVRGGSRQPHRPDWQRAGPAGVEIRARSVALSRAINRPPNMGRGIRFDCRSSSACLTLARGHCCPPR